MKLICGCSGAWSAMDVVSNIKSIAVHYYALLKQVDGQSLNYISLCIAEETPTKLLVILGPCVEMQGSYDAATTLCKRH